MKKIVLYLFCILIMRSLYAQDYLAYLNKGKELYNAQAYIQSLKAYQKAFKLGAKNWNGISSYWAACSATLSGNVDTAFYYLELTIKSGYLNVVYMNKDSDLTLLHKDKRWKIFIKKMRKKKEKIRRDKKSII